MLLPFTVWSSLLTVISASNLAHRLHEQRGGAGVQAEAVLDLQLTRHAGGPDPPALIGACPDAAPARE